MVRHLRHNVVFGALLASVLFSSAAFAQTVTVNIEATVTYVDDWSNKLGGQVQVGDIVTGTYTYDLATADNNYLSTVGDYWSSTGGFQLMLNGQPFRTTQGAPYAFLAEVIDNHMGFDGLVLRSYQNDANAWGPVSHVAWQLVDYSMAALSSTNLPAGAPDISSFQQYGLDLEGGGDYYYYDRYFVRAMVTRAWVGPKYEFTGFSRPIVNAPAKNAVKAGQSVPVKFSLGGDQGLDIFGAGSPASVPVDCTSLAPLGASSSVSNAGGSSLTYDPATDEYSFVWKTDKSWANSCRHLVLTLADGSVHSAVFNFRK